MQLGESWGRRHLGSAVVLLAATTLASPEALAQGQQGSNGGWSRGCPPNNYNQAGDCVNHQPPFDHSPGTDGRMNSWDVPMTLPKPVPPGGNYSTTDECGNTVCILGIPDPAGPGKGADHYSPRFKKAGGPADGEEVGQCVYSCGRNSWKLTFVDADGDCVPDKFTGSTWESRDGGTDAGDWPFSGQITTFETDLLAAKIVPVRTVPLNPPPLPFNGYRIEDATIVNLGTDLSGVVLAGQPIGFPSDIVTQPGVANGLARTAPLENNLATSIPRAEIGQPINATGLITNTDNRSHQYSVVFFGVHAQILNPPASLHLGPGQTGSYQVQGIVTAAALQGGGGVVDTGALISFAYSETGDGADGRLAVALFDINPCRAGTVNAGAGPVTNVLFVNGSAGDPNRRMTVAVGAPIEISLLTAPLGPALARYLAYVWLANPVNPRDLVAQGSNLGCTVNPTPLEPGQFPQPFRCLRGAGIPAVVCNGVTELPSPARAPWTVRRNQGFPSPATLSIQAVLQDAGAKNAAGYSVTNAVILRVQ